MDGSMHAPRYVKNLTTYTVRSSRKSGLLSIFPSDKKKQKEQLVCESYWSRKQVQGSGSAY